MNFKVGNCEARVARHGNPSIGICFQCRLFSQAVAEALRAAKETFPAQRRALGKYHLVQGLKDHNF